ncbi:AMP-binding enzyme [Aeromicrobium marinum DSM 15272]|uniref:AMP-binding enzyme n=1 Tax=Aeromicrobium marinum DSM 15272 TaxID=585531 RepID=E2SDH3_9ACTN|nr:AMP-binding protein [Aeromicrobium marinum]EFQ82550.1 AMP-binding enzyme [Aeromicrobium marinum DSM 15272]
MLTTTRRSVFADLARHGDRAAFVTTDRTLTYRDLAERVDDVGRRLGATRRLVAVPLRNDVDSLCTYLGAVAAGHAVLVTSPDRAATDALTAAYDPDVVAGEQWQVRRTGSAHDLHPDLAVLLSTSGSTGSPRLVRLSGTNVRSNAQSIAEYLRITPDDRALTTLPPHYCYGLSVVHSHLVAGAGLVLTEGSVVDDSTWQLAAAAGATSFAGVPYTFEMLDTTDFAARDLPHLRLVTQAGGRMAPDDLRRWWHLGRRRGWDLVPMYGQTEATARMAYLPPDLVPTHAHTLGIAVPGGSFRLDPVPEAAPGTGELVYRGDNVMMGYAERPTDLARGPELDELRTGDLARRHDDGSLEWVGRRHRIAKCSGLRIDLDHLERRLDDAGFDTRCVAVDDRPHVLTVHHDVDLVRRTAADVTGLPSHRVSAHTVATYPRTDRGKVDYPALTTAARDAATRASAARVAGPAAVRHLVADLLDRPDARDDQSFVDLGGDSLSYVEVSVRLADLGVDLPPGWHLRPLAELTAGPAEARRGVPVDTSVVLRALAIVLVVGSHGNLWALAGGAHILLGIAGYNAIRFRAGAGSTRARVTAGLRSLSRLVVPSALWIGGVALVTGMYDPATAVFLNGALGEDRWTVQWQFWFLEAVVWTQLAVVVALAVPALDRWHRRSPFSLASAVLAVALAARYLLVGVEAGPTERYSVAVVAWCFAAGWAAATVRTTGQRVLLSGVLALAPVGFFGEPQREVLVGAGLLALLWVPRVPLPRIAALLVGQLAGASLFVYLTHWQVYPHLEDVSPPAAVAASFVVGVAAWRGWEALTGTAGIGRLRGLRTAARPAAGGADDAVPVPLGRRAG